MGVMIKKDVRCQSANEAVSCTSPAHFDLADDLPTAAPLARSHTAQQHFYINKNQAVHKAGQNQIEQLPTSLAVEAAIAVVINGIHYAVLMASPSQLEYLAVGFLFSEGLIQHSYELLDWEVINLADNDSLSQFSQSDNEANAEHLAEQLQDYDVYIVDLTLSQRCHQRIQAQKRQLAGRTGCGMCGMTGLTQALPDLSEYAQDLSDQSKPSLDALLRIRERIDAAQHTHQLTGAVHAAATVVNDQLYLFEDVGRHNALDKLIGWQLRHKQEIDCVVMTSRISIELVQKSIRMRLPWLVGMSAPTSTAVRVAERYGLGLAGFLRNNRVTYYTDL